MPLWKITARNSWVFSKDQALTKGMFIEMSTPSTTPPLNLARNAEIIAQAFNSKYSTKLDKSKINGGHFICEKIG